MAILVGRQTHQTHNLIILLKNDINSHKVIRLGELKEHFSTKVTLQK